MLAAGADPAYMRCVYRHWIDCEARAIRRWKTQLA
jgi:hypothetical protein